MIAAGLLASSLNLDPGSWIAWILVGLIAGAIAARVVAGRGFGCIADIVVGVAGAIIGGFLLSTFFGVSGNVGFWGSIVVAFIGAAVLLAALKLEDGSSPEPSRHPAAALTSSCCGVSWAPAGRARRLINVVVSAVKARKTIGTMKVACMASI